MNPRCIRGVSLDAGGTLIEPRPSVGHVYAAVAARFGINADPNILNDQFLRGWKSKHAFDYTRAQWFGLVEQAFAGIAPVSSGLFDSIYQQFALEQTWHIYEDVIPALKALKERGIRLVVISNWDERLRPLLRELDLERYFDGLIISTEVGAHKPDERIFNAALGKLGMTGEEVLHVGDSEHEDVRGAEAAGMAAMRIDRGGGMSGGIRELTEILNRI